MSTHRLCCCGKGIPTRPCCFDNGSCDVLSDLDCLALDGTPTGIVGQDCADVTCKVIPQPQPCCFWDGSCQILTPSACTVAGGTPTGTPNDLCVDVTCLEDPHCVCSDDCALNVVGAPLGFTATLTNTAHAGSATYSGGPISFTRWAGFCWYDQLPTIQNLQCLGFSFPTIHPLWSMSGHMSATLLNCLLDGQEGTWVYVFRAVFTSWIGDPPCMTNSGAIASYTNRLEKPWLADPCGLGPYTNSVFQNIDTPGTWEMAVSFAGVDVS